jgi:predicted nucleic acid-binding protein
MTKLYLDTNIFIDFLTNRAEKTVGFDEILPYIDRSQIFLSTLSIHIIYYTLKIKKGTKIHRKIQEYVELINLIPLDYNIVTTSIDNFTKDFEDTLQYYSALSADCDYILTRDTKDFLKIKEAIPSEIEIVTDLKDTV